MRYLARPVLLAPEVAEEEQDVGKLLEDRPLPGELPRHPLIIVVEKSHEVTGRRPDARVAGGARPAMLPGKIADRRTEGPDHRLRVVAGPVVYHDDFVPGLTLGEHRAQGARQELRPIVGRNHH